MYALIVPASTPFVLLAVVMALSWWEDHILPTSPTEPAELSRVARSPRTSGNPRDPEARRLP
ncbi:hypothetical protein [Streptomyces sviceus]|uniref:hypothetical protein n=1 Tax=Streptomyces sviceus TaxID=285530 RepID=UPI0036B3DF26